MSPVVYKVACTLVSESITLQEVVPVLDVMADFHSLGNPELPHTALFLEQVFDDQCNFTLTADNAYVEFATPMKKT